MTPNGWGKFFLDVVQNSTISRKPSSPSLPFRSFHKKIRKFRIRSGKPSKYSVKICPDEFSALSKKNRVPHPALLLPREKMKTQINGPAPGRRKIAGSVLVLTGRTVNQLLYGQYTSALLFQNFGYSRTYSIN